MVGTYNGWLVTLSIVVAIVSSYVALDLGSRVTSAQGYNRAPYWLVGGALSLGSGIWSMHFIGMLAFSLPCGIGYNPLLTLVSILPGVLASGVALFVLSRKDRSSQKLLFVCALLVGAGIGAMHYSGMAAMRPAALLRYDIRIVGLSVVVAVLTAAFLLALSEHLDHGPQLGGVGNRLLGRDRGTGIVADIDATMKSWRASRAPDSTTRLSPP